MTQSTLSTPGSLLDGLATHLHGLRFSDLPDAVVTAAKERLIDTLAALLAGQQAETAQLARRIAGRLPADAPEGAGARIIGTTERTSVDAAAFANSASARGVDTLDAYHHGGKQGHPADVVAPLLTVADHAGASGEELILAIAIAYETFCWLRDGYEQEGFDNTNCARLATAAGVARLLRLDPAGIAACIALTGASDNTLKEVRSRPAVMTRATASAYGARGAVFAGLLAAAGARAPSGAFDGADGWVSRIAGGALDLGKLGGFGGSGWRITETWLKMRAIPGVVYPLVIAAEKLVPLVDPDQIETLAIEVYRKLYKGFGQAEKHWSPKDRDTADHSVPYIVSSILTRGELALDAFDSPWLNEPRLRALMPRITVAENADFTQAYADRHDHRARLTVTLRSGETVAVESGGDADDFAAPRSRTDIEAKFLWLAGPVLGEATCRTVLEDWWRLEAVTDVAPLLTALVPTV